LSLRLNSPPEDIYEQMMNRRRPWLHLFRRLSPSNDLSSWVESIRFLLCSFVKIDARCSCPATILPPGRVGCAARMAGGRTFKATADHTLMRGLDTAGPLIRLGLADCLSAGIGDPEGIAGHKGTSWVPGLALPPVTRAGDVGWWWDAVSSLSRWSSVQPGVWG
jgi:hypothetical protein